MPLSRPSQALISLCALATLSLATPAHADDYDFTEETAEQPTGDGGGGGGGGGDDFEFDTPLDTSDTGGGGGGGTPSFLQATQGGGVEEESQRRPLTPEELAALRAAEAERVWVLQRRPFLKKHRLELAPMAGLNANDPLIHFATVGADLNYFLNEEMAIGLRGSYTLNVETSSFDEVVQEYSVFPKISRPIWSGSANFQYTPLYGKLAVFGSWILPWELYTRAGVGWLQTFIDGRVFVTAGAGQRYFMNRWMTFNLDLNYQIFQETFGPDESVLLNNLVFSVGMSFYLPTDFEYRELR